MIIFLKNRIQKRLRTGAIVLEMHPAESIDSCSAAPEYPAVF